MSVGAERHIEDGTALSLQVTDRQPGLHVPDANRLFVETGSKPAAVGAKGDGIDPTAS
jgi:hypothetical protein